LFRRWLWAVSDALAITPALPVALLFPHRRRPVTLLCLPARPCPRRLPAPLAAIALTRLPRAETPFTSFQQTTPGARQPSRPFPPGAFLISRLACRILGRAHGSDGSQKLLPWRGKRSSPGRRQASGSARELHRKPTRAPGRFRSLSFLPHGVAVRMRFGPRLFFALCFLKRYRASRSGATARTDSPSSLLPADMSTAIDLWHRGPSWRCRIGPFAECHRHPHW